MLILDSGMSLGSPGQSPLLLELLLSVLPRVTVRPHKAMNPYRNTLSTHEHLCKGLAVPSCCAQNHAKAHSHAHAQCPNPDMLHAVSLSSHPGPGHPTSLPAISVLMILFWSCAIREWDLGPGSISPQIPPG